MLYNELFNLAEQNYKVKIAKNPDTADYERISNAVKANDGYCPCLLTRSPDTKCPCKSFRDSNEAGFCHCERYYKTPNPATVCLCGSTRFKDAFLRVQDELARAGFIVLSVGTFCHQTPETITANTKQHLDDLHKVKIAQADYIVILNQDLYIGPSTQSELQFATTLKKPIFYLEEEN